MKLNMKLLGFLLMATLFLSSFAFAVDNSALRLNFINQDPDPASPGQYVDLKVRADNVGTGDAQDVVVSFVDSFPFALDPGTDAKVSVGTVGANQKGDLAPVVEFRVRVAQDALEGVNKVKFGVSSKNQPMQTYEFNVDVKTQDSGLTIKSVRSDQLVQGEPGVVELILENPSDSALRDVTVNLDLDSDSLPFAPSDSSTTKKINLLGSGNLATFRFSLVPFPDADSKVYKVPVTITYYDSTNEFVEKSDLIGIVVGSDAKVSYYIESDDFKLGQKDGVLTLNFVNKGLIDIKFLDVIATNTRDYELMSGKEAYIGEVDSDDFETADFKIRKLNDNAEFNFVAKATFMDANNNEYEVDLELPVKLYPMEESNGNGTLIFVIVLLVVGFFGFRYYKKKNKKRK